MKKIIMATSIAVALAGCNNGPDEVAMKGAIEEALGNHIARQMQTAMLQGNLNRAMEGFGAAGMSVGAVKKKSCETTDPGFYCNIDVPITVRDQLHTLDATVHFWYVEKKLVADVYGILDAKNK